MQFIRQPTYFLFNYTYKMGNYPNRIYFTDTLAVIPPAFMM